MPHLQTPGYSGLRVASLILLVFTAWFSEGYHHPDEHFQVLEFCNYKMGLSPATDLPWEYGVHCRSSLLPWVAVSVCNTMTGLHLYDPFVAAFFLRLLMGLATWWMTGQMIRAFSQDLTTGAARFLFSASMSLLWFVPYLAVRFSAENVSCLLLFAAITLLYTYKNESRYPARMLLLCGMLLALALFVRLQIGFALVGVSIWIFFIAKFRRRDILTLLAGAAMGIGLAVVADRLFYGTWLLTPYNYFDISILQHKAENWGETPWWYYLWMFLQMGLPPISIALTIGFAIGIRDSLRHLLCLSILAMIAGHMLIGHKEMRFLFPMYPAFIFLFCRGSEQLAIRFARQKWYRTTCKTLVALNLVALVFRCTTPAQEAIGYYKYIYLHNQQEATTLLYEGQSAYNMPGNSNLEMNFYKPVNLRTKPISALNKAGRQPMTTTTACLLLSDHPVENDPNLKPTYCLFPEWLLKYNIFHWKERSNIWVLYQVGSDVFE